MRHLLAAIAFLIAGISASSAQFSSGNLGSGGFQPPQGFSTPSGGGFIASCSQSAAYIARATGIASYSTFETQADAAICGAVTDGFYSKLDEWYFLAAPTQAIADLNVVSSSGTGVPTGTYIFDPMVGYTGDGSTSLLTTQNFSGGGFNYTLNAASMGGCVMNARTTTDIAGYFMVMYTAPSDSALTVMASTGPSSRFIVNHTGSDTPGSTQTNSRGTYAAVRTSSSLTSLYYQCNSTSCANFGTDSTASTSIPNTTMKIIDTGHDTWSWAFVGGALSTTDLFNIRTRMNTFLSNAVGFTGC